MGVHNKLQQGLFGTSPVATHGTGNAQAEEAMAACLRLFPVLRDPCEPSREGGPTSLGLVLTTTCRETVTRVSKEPRC